MNAKLTVLIGLSGILLAVFWSDIIPYLGKFLGNSIALCPWAVRSGPDFIPGNALEGRNKLSVQHDKTTKWKTFSIEDLAKYDGSDEELPILLSIGGKVFDVTEGKRFYGVGETYHQFAGRASTRGLSLPSMELDDISDDVSDFSDEKLQEVENMITFYSGKYPQVGILEEKRN